MSPQPPPDAPQPAAPAAAKRAGAGDDDVVAAAHRQTLRDLRERIKELNCLYSITRLAQREDLSTQELIRGIAEEVRASWQYPEITCARVAAEGLEHRTNPYRQSPWTQTALAMVRGEPVGLVEVRYLEACPPCDEGPFLREERHLIDAVADLLSQIITARRSKAHARQLARELIKAQEDERKRIALELHDKAAQDLSLLNLELLALQERHGPLPEAMASHVSRLQAQTSSIVSEIRDISYALLPPDLEQLGLAAAAFSLCQQFTARHGLNLEFSADGMEGLPLDFETQINLYRIIQEGLANIRKHSGARHARVLLVASHPHVILRIEDDGVGFDPQAEPGPAHGGTRMGLYSMRERARLLGGLLTVRARPGRGVRLLVEVPVREAGAP